MLSNIRVLEVAYFYPGPFCTQILAEHGAEVIKIEPPTGDPMRYDRTLFSAFNRNKKSIVLNLKDEGDLKKFYELVKKSDVIVEGFRPGVAKRLGIDYDTVRKYNKGIIYCSISGFGQDSELLDIPVHDINVLSFSGICRISGIKDNVPRDPNVQISDFSSAVFAVISILMALIKRMKTGEGEYIDVSMMDSAAASIPLHSASYMNGSSDRMDFKSNPGYEIYKTRDGHISLGIMDEPHFWRNLCRVLEIEEYADISYAERLERYDEIRSRISEIIMKFKTSEISDILRRNNIPFGVVNHFTDAVELLKKRGILAKTENGIFVGFPAKYKYYTPKRDGKVPDLGGDEV
ncbi:putative acyl-CoA transferases/carnitine dehydratase [Archaeoglobus sulfaticallidus PM70-1]|uniref:Putative acyl-CoA transferases/carnitine dehydratase n=1 Tax=Archaeoglobus sulfaticallidus PM70-1 TaxID=387631 RepID=N0BLK9_9EURY|nr:CoA transferase [Archaeoglobus sulfaticallidus]AGK61095.1 putative acyl-CoA transferases/carnitine dehydratase [Archaeoglobus sulfaticallidus PM70-1]